jgi:CMP-N,N'-diacetyllegionaminic acid synthase
VKILALILARGGSKRLPGKNIRFLGGKPLIVWSIDVAKNIPEICDILVSTDDPVIEAVAKGAGALVPWLRPVELATDTASSVDAALHALDWYETENGAVDGLLLLQPTSPFRTKETVKRGIALFKKNNHQTVLGVSPAHAHPMWSFKIDGDYLVPFIQEHGLGKRSQDLPSAYVVNGCCYIITPVSLREERSFIGNNTIPLLIDSQKEALDIDTEWDWVLAECIIKLINAIKPLLL